MDDQAIIAHYGNPQLPKGSREQPVVTFALFAFNQERFIREAIEGAFAQTYTPLEIILTDDCSSDATPAIMEEMAAAYQGQHRVIVRRGLENVGTLSHVLYAARLAEGELFVVAAGDDISLPERTSIIAQALSDPRYLAFSSDEVGIDEDFAHYPMATSSVEERLRLHRANPAWVHGATAAYRTDLLKGLPMPQGPILLEDRVLTDVVTLMGKESIRSTEALIYYRKHDGNLWNARKQVLSVEEAEARSIVNFQRHAVAKQYVIDLAQRRSSDFPISDDVVRRFLSEHAYFDYMARWREIGFSERIRAISKIGSSHRYWHVLKRLFGYSAFLIFAKRR
jgi:glycosyltransferase involved in cell wall biosynthesis